MKERLEGLELEHRQLLNKTVDSKLKRLRGYVSWRRLCLIFLLPPFVYMMSHLGGLEYSTLTWVLLFLFVAVIASRQLILLWLMEKIDCVKMTVRETCLAENRFRRAFKIGLLISVLSAIPLLTSLMWDISDSRYTLMGMWIGLLLGSLMGGRLCYKAWQGVKELKEAVADLQ